MALTTNIVAYWKFDESSGNAADSTGNGRTLTNVNTVTYVAGKIGNAGHFVPGSSQKENRTDISGTTAGGNISISCWIKINNAPASNIQQVLVDVASSVTSPYISYWVEYFNNAGTLQLRFNRQKQAVSNNFISETVTLTTGTYYHIVATYDGTNSNLYRNGSLVAGPTAESGNGTGPNDVVDETVIGALHSAQGSFADADIDEVGIWSRALTSGEVTSLYNGGVGLSYPFSSGNSNFLAFM